jgi:hypothetical protein
LSKKRQLLAQTTGIEAIASLPCSKLRSRRRKSGKYRVIPRVRCPEKGRNKQSFTLAAVAGTGAVIPAAPKPPPPATQDLAR